MTGRETFFEIRLVTRFSSNRAYFPERSQFGDCCSDQVDAPGEKPAKDNSEDPTVRCSHPDTVKTDRAASCDPPRLRFRRVKREPFSVVAVFRYDQFSEDFRGRTRIERAVAAEDLNERATQAVKVRSFIDALPRCLFERHLPQRSAKFSVWLVQLSGAIHLRLAAKSSPGFMDSS